MFGPHLLTSEIQFGVCDELDADSVTAPISATENGCLFGMREKMRKHRKMKQS